ncbi:hypothetical protein [Rhodanobacter sp. C05]|uniref:hypothetical protein n=1 Tax=Rhodanobacter sp. C05 TaxID=1945855 RepID=UPI000985EC47|nr:hypothetical protein [Rhodanobacter sp. C05]OOG41363.1 hypothetical protein B0E51_06550 [Rhodanobacter sp. C05]
MKKRHVFSTSNVAAAQSAVQSARTAGVPDDDISLIARDDIQLDKIPDHRQEPKEDFGRGGAKGVLMGGGSGLLAGIVAITVAPVGLTLAGVAAMTLAGAAAGGWVGMLTGTAEPDIVRRTFEEEIAAGRVLIVIDGDDHTLASADAAMKSLGARRLPFDAPTAMS